jgi:hypothetical protein
MMMFDTEKRCIYVDRRKVGNLRLLRGAGLAIWMQLRFLEACECNYFMPAQLARSVGLGSAGVITSYIRRFEEEGWIELHDITAERRYPATGWICEYCGKESSTLERHHIVPKAEGGPDVCENLIDLCPDCHTKMHAIHFRIIEYVL